MATKHTFKENALRIIAVVGLIAVLVLGAWGIIQLAFFIPGFVSSLVGSSAERTAAKETLSVAIPVAVNTGASFPITWTHKNGSGTYGYTLSYACAEDLSVKAPLPNGEWQAVSCDTPFNYTNATEKLSVIATASGSKALTANFTVAATKLSSGEVSVTASANTSVSPAKKTVKTATASKTAVSAKTGYVAGGRTTNLYGSPDLQVRFLSNPGTVYGGSQVSLQFVVENVGTNVAPANWIFTAALPYQGGYTYQSPAQQALYPGDKIVFTLGYTAVAQNQNTVCTMQYPNYNCPQPYYGGTQYDPYNPSWTYPYGTLGGYPSTYSGYGYGMTQTASVTVDPYNLVWESNEVNNTASITYQAY